MTRIHFPFAAAALVLLLSLHAEAQVPPFFDGGAGIFDPEIDVVQSGVLLDAQAVVSADRKYVTLNMRAQNAQLLALREFAFQAGGGVPPGQVGGAAGAAGAAGAVGAADGAARGAATAIGATGAAAPQHKVFRTPYPRPGQTHSADRTPLLQKQGMTLVSRVTSGAAGRAPLK